MIFVVYNQATGQYYNVEKKSFTENNPTTFRKISDCQLALNAACEATPFDRFDLDMRELKVVDITRSARS